MPAPERHRIVILCGPRAWHEKTCATLISAGLDVVGICVCNQQSAGLPLAALRRSARKLGWSTALGQAAGRLAYLIRNRRRDRRASARLFPRQESAQTLAAWGGPVHRTTDYGSSKTMAWLSSLAADLFVIHTPYWVGKQVRAIPREGIVLGGHPGLTPRYRGSHAAFWALLHDAPEDVGCTIFWVDGGVDTGDIIRQERIQIQPGDSYVTLGWKGMIRQAEMLAEVLSAYDQGEPIPRHPVGEIPQGSLFPLPTLADHLRYWRRQKVAR